MRSTSDNLVPGLGVLSAPDEQEGIAMAKRLTVSVRGPLGLDDGRRLTDELEQATGLVWRGEPVKADGHLDGGIVEIVLVAVLGKTTELAYGAVMEKARGRIEQWRSERLDKPDYTLIEETVAGADETAEGVGAGGNDSGPQAPESEG
jgi:hypothetical protein